MILVPFADDDAAVAADSGRPFLADHDRASPADRDRTLLTMDDSASSTGRRTAHLRAGVNDEGSDRDRGQP